MRVRLQLAGMSCQHCVRAVTQALQGIAGVHAAEVSLEPQEAWVDYDPDQASLEAMRAAVEAEGYQVVAVDPVEG